MKMNLFLEDHFQNVFQDCDPEDAELITEEEPVEAMKESGAGLTLSLSTLQEGESASS